jgi:hypothetical protein
MASATTTTSANDDRGHNNDLGHNLNDDMTT